eukprot:2730456-Prymnesium_polylepis.1
MRPRALDLLAPHLAARRAARSHRSLQRHACQPLWIRQSPATGTHLCCQDFIAPAQSDNQLVAKG